MYAWETAVSGVVYNHRKSELGYIFKFFVATIASMQISFSKFSCYMSRTNMFSLIGGESGCVERAKIF